MNEYSWISNYYTVLKNAMGDYEFDMQQWTV